MQRIAMNKQKRWNRYVNAINYCISYGYFIVPCFSKNDNVKSISVIYDNGREVTIPLKTKRYKGDELLEIIIRES